MRTNLIKVAVSLVLLSAATVPLGYDYLTVKVDAATVIKPIANQKVYLTTKSYMVVRDAQFLIQDEGKLLAVNFSIINNDTKSINLIDYWVKINSTSGKTFKVKLSDADSSKKVVPAGGSINLTYYATVDESAEISNIRFDIIKWDFSVKGYEKKLGAFQYPKGTALDTAAYKSKVMLYDNTKINSAIKQYFVSKDSSYANLSLNFTFENVGYRSTNLSKLKFYIQTDDLSLYDVKVPSLTDMILQPKDTQIINLSAQVPLSVATKRMSLVVVNDLGNNLTLPIGSFTLPSNVTTPSTSKSFTYNNMDVSLEKIQRIPGDNRDILTAEVKVTNKAITTQKVPNLSGQFMVSGIKANDDTTNTAVLDQLLSLLPGQSYTYVVYSEIPYSSNSDGVSFAVTEAVQGGTGSGSQPKVLHEFPVTAPSSINLSKTDIPYNIDNIGQKAEVQIVKSGMYKGDKSNFFYTELVYHNLESRLAKTVNLGGFIQNAKQDIIPINFSKYEQKVFPDGKVLITGWTKVPKNFSLDQSRLYLGQSLSTSATADITPMAKPVAYQLDVNSGTKNDFQGITFMNKSLSIRNFFPTLDTQPDPSSGGFVVNGINLKFTYDLESIPDYENPDEGQKLVIEFVDKDKNNADYRKELALTINKDEADAVKLKEGTAIDQEIVFKDLNAISTLIYYQKYTINLYYVFQDTRLLLATKEFEWYTNGN